MSVVNYGNKAPAQQNAISALYQKVRLENEAKSEGGEVPAGISSSGLRMSLENKSEDENGKVTNGISSSGPRVSLQNKPKDENGKEIPCWSLFYMGKKSKEWGFMRHVYNQCFRWIHHEAYLKDKKQDDYT